jgi:hypothetical protein
LISASFLTAHDSGNECSLNYLFPLVLLFST